MHGTTHLPGGLALRPARPSDSGFIGRLYRCTRGDLRQLDADPDFIQALIGQQYQARARAYGEMYPDSMDFIVERQGEAIGRVLLDFGRDRVRIVDIGLIEPARGRGIGRIVLRTLQQAARTVCAPLVLTVHPANQVARRLYSELGFRVEEGSPVAERMAWYPEPARAATAGPATTRTDR